MYSCKNDRHGKATINNENTTIIHSPKFGVPGTAFENLINKFFFINTLNI